MAMRRANISILILSALLGVSHAYAEKPLGYLAPSTPGVAPSVDNPIETLKLPLYNAPGGDKIGNAIVTEGYFDLCFTPVSYKGKQFAIYDRSDAILLKKHDYLSAGDCNQYTFYDVHDGYARILSRSIEGGAWVRLHNAPANVDGLKIVLEPRDFFYRIERVPPQSILGYYNHRLRRQPSLDAKILVTLSNTRIIHQFTGRIENGWAEAIVWEMSRPLDLACTSSDEYSTAATGRKWSGWVRILNENGEPDGITFEPVTC